MITCHRGLYTHVSHVTQATHAKLFDRESDTTNHGLREKNGRHGVVDDSKTTDQRVKYRGYSVTSVVFAYGR